MVTLYVHINDQEPFLAEVEDLPDPSDQYILLKNPRQRDGKDLRYLMDEVTAIILPWWRIVYIEIVPAEEEEEVFTPFRD